MVSCYHILSLQGSQVCPAAFAVRAKCLALLFTAPQALLSVAARRCWRALLLARASCGLLLSLLCCRAVSALLLDRTSDEVCIGVL